MAAARALAAAQKPAALPPDGTRRAMNPGIQGGLLPVVRCAQPANAVRYQHRICVVDAGVGKMVVGHLVSRPDGDTDSVDVDGVKQHHAGPVVATKGVMLHRASMNVGCAMA
jgi:hypothetical protein